MYKSEDLPIVVQTGYPAYATNISTIRTTTQM